MRQPQFGSSFKHLRTLARSGAVSRFLHHSRFPFFLCHIETTRQACQERGGREEAQKEEGGGRRGGRRGGRQEEEARQEGEETCRPGGTKAPPDGLLHLLRREARTGSLSLSQISEVNARGSLLSLPSSPLLFFSSRRSLRTRPRETR